MTSLRNIPPVAPRPIVPSPLLIPLLNSLPTQTERTGSLRWRVLVLGLFLLRKQESDPAVKSCAGPWPIQTLSLEYRVPRARFLSATGLSF